MNKSDFQKLFDRLPKVGDSYKSYENCFVKYTKDRTSSGKIRKKTNPELKKGDSVIHVSSFDFSYKKKKIVIIHFSKKIIELNEPEIDEWIQQILRGPKTKKVFK
jgi:hypothetical protein